MATAPCFPVMLTQQTATQRLVWGPAALWDGGQTQSHEETEGHKPCGAVWCGAVRCVREKPSHGSAAQLCLPRPPGSSVCYLQPAALSSY